MPFQLTKTYPRLWSLDAGVAMVVTDLHGDWDAYARYRDRFIELRTAGQADCLILSGDLIHREPEAGADRSLAIVLDLLALQERYGDAIIYLCGNHELPHLYGFVLGKGNTEYTPSFEAALSQSGCRGDVLGLFESLPFFVRTAILMQGSMHHPGDEHHIRGDGSSSLTISLYPAQPNSNRRSARDATRHPKRDS